MIAWSNTPVRVMVSSLKFPLSNIGCPANNCLPVKCFLNHDVSWNGKCLLIQLLRTHGKQNCPENSCFKLVSLLNRHENSTKNDSFLTCNVMHTDETCSTWTAKFLGWWERWHSKCSGWSSRQPRWRIHRQWGGVPKRGTLLFPFVHDQCVIVFEWQQEEIHHARQLVEGDPLIIRAPVRKSERFALSNTWSWFVMYLNIDHDSSVALNKIMRLSPYRSPRSSCGQASYMYICIKCLRCALYIRIECTRTSPSKRRCIHVI